MGVAGHDCGKIKAILKKQVGSHTIVKTIV